MRGHAWRAAALVACLLLLLLLLWPARRDRTRALALKQSLAALERRAPGSEVACARLAAQRPFVLLVLGQSNAANHGAGTAPQAAIPVFFHGRCFAAHEPLPGGSGEGASLWPRVAADLGGQIQGRPLLFVQLAVASTTIADWTAAGPLRDSLDAELQGLARSGFAVDAVLWQQGEADALAHTTTLAYLHGLGELLRLLAARGVDAPVVVALSTYCPGGDGSQVRAAIRQFSRGAKDFVVGPDTDALRGAMRSGGCHFSEAGLGAAAAEWAATLRTLK